ncbi:MAG: Lrp/AsnC ligand binding domain-containing protein [Nitrososphaerota archaeon]|nr:Lrp/AsnC ligand binding domain-containing protein [Nitrososphaerota archaeon]
MGRVLAFVNIFVESGSTSAVIEELRMLPNLEELYEVAGEFDIVSTFSADDLEELRHILVSKIMKIKGVRSTVTDIVLHSHRPSPGDPGEARAVPR